MKRDSVESYTQEYIWSMALLGNLSELPRSGKLSYKRESYDIGEVDFPPELFKLEKIARDWDVWYYGDVPKNPAFGLASIGSYHSSIRGMNFLYGVNSKITGLEFQISFDFKLNVPEGFTIDALVRLMLSGESEIETFCLTYGKLNPVQKERIKKHGLDGLRNR